MKKRVIRLTETDIKNIVRRVISEQNIDYTTEDFSQDESELDDQFTGDDE